MKSSKEIFEIIYPVRQELLDFCHAHKRIFLYGAGEWAERVYAYLEHEGITLSGVVATATQESKFHGFSVMPIAKMSFEEGDGVLLAMKDSYCREVLPVLEKMGMGQDVFCAGTTRSVPNAVDYLDGTTGMTLKSGKYFASFDELEKIGAETKTDKAEVHHDYLRKYEFFLQTFRERKMILVEMGVLKGSSLSMWGKYFPKAEVYGIDIDPACKQYQGENRTVWIRDLSLDTTLQEIAELHPTIIVDDASHYWSHQILALFRLFPALTAGGVYIVEDIETSFSAYAGMGCDDAAVSVYDVLKVVAEVVTSREHLRETDLSPQLKKLCNDIEELATEVDLISFIHGSCILVKR